MARKKILNNDDRSRDAFVRIFQAREKLHADLEGLLKEHGLTEPQYNVLRIIRGSGIEGLPCLEIGRRMITRVPDITRLLDRLEKMGLVGRERSTDDRRIVIAYLTKKGTNLLLRLDKPVNGVQKRHFTGLTKSEIAGLVEVLGKIVDLDR